MEPLILKNESYSYTFYKKMIENIKQTKDAQNPDDETANMVGSFCFFSSHKSAHDSFILGAEIVCSVRLGSESGADQNH